MTPLSIDWTPRPVGDLTCCDVDDASNDSRFTRNIRPDGSFNGTLLSDISRHNPRTNRNVVPDDTDVIIIDESPVRVLESSMKSEGPGMRVSNCKRNIMASFATVATDIDTDDDVVDVGLELLPIRRQSSSANFSQTLGTHADTPLTSSPLITRPRRLDRIPIAEPLGQQEPLHDYKSVNNDYDDDIITVSDASTSSTHAVTSYSATTSRPCATPLYNFRTKKSGRSLDSGSDSEDDLAVSDVQSFLDKFSTISARESSGVPSVTANTSLPEASKSRSYVSAAKSTSGILASIAASKQAHRAASAILPMSFTNIEVEDLIVTSSSSPVGNVNAALLRRKSNDIDNVASTRNYSANTRSILDKLDSFSVDKFTQQHQNEAGNEAKNSVARGYNEDESPKRRNTKRRNQQENTVYGRKQTSEDIPTAKKRAIREKEAERERKRKEKEQLSLERQRQHELAAVNKLKMSKKDTCAEMIVDIDADFAKTVSGQKLLSILVPLGIEVSTSWTSPTRNMIKWRRKVKAEYNDALGLFVPIPEEIRKECFILIVLTGVEFVDMVIENQLAENVTSIRRIYPDLKLIYMIEGLNSFFKKMTTQTQRQFNDMVQDALGNSQNRTKKPRNEEGDLFVKVQGMYNHRQHADVVEDSLIMLQVVYDCLVFHSTTSLDSAEWIAILTQDIGTIPYKNARMNLHETICMESGQVKAGTTTKDTFSQTLRQVKYITPGLSKGILDRYGTINEMMKALESRGSDAFMAIGGEASSRKIGRTLANNLDFIFSATDPNACAP
ncbi:hypothetical protein V1525DRAFT_401218 [Lipomyces kononenkoae]|uniref:Uncharacterized protein n=1 Tax=Lipomyces kononenkoae TaxID=34357 RepID=A0ACC3T362_LIPKO